MILLMKDVIVKKGLKVLELLACDEIYFSTDNECAKLTRDFAVGEEFLASNQEEADTKVVRHCKHALARSPNKNIILRSPSADIDITVIMTGKCIEEKDHCFIDYGTGKNRRGTWLGNIDMKATMKEALIGFHAFTGNDYVSSFFRKGKEACWKIVENNPKFCEAFQLLGVSWNLTDSVFNLLEKFVCFLYGYKKKSVNSVRHLRSTARILRLLILRCYHPVNQFSNFTHTDQASSPRFGGHQINLN